MDLKKFLMATVGGFFAMFIPGGLWHMLIMKDFSVHSYFNNCAINMQFQVN